MAPKVGSQSLDLLTFLCDAMQLLFSKTSNVVRISKTGGHKITFNNMKIINDK